MADEDHGDDRDGWTTAPEGLTEANDDDLDDDGVISLPELARAAMSAGANDGEVTDDEIEVARLIAAGEDPFAGPADDD